jgi:hypothetical protein
MCFVEPDKKVMAEAYQKVYCKGEYMVRCGVEILSRGNIDLQNLSKPENYFFSTEWRFFP